MAGITAKNYKRAEALLERAKKDPNTDPARLNNLQMQLNSFYENATDEALGKEPVAAMPEAVPTAARREGVGGYFYEPSVEEFQGALKDRKVREILGLGDTYSSGETSGESYLKSKVPALAGMSKTDISRLSENSDEYKKYSDYAYQEALKKDPDLARYSQLDVTNNPFKKSLGAVVKHGPAAVLGAEKTLGLGVPRLAAQVIASSNPDSAADAQYDPMGSPVNESHPEKARAIREGIETAESLSPTAGMLGQLGGYVVPWAPSNAASRGLQGALGYAAANPFTKAGISGLVGGITSAGEGAIQDFTENPDISGQQLLDNSIPRAVWGAAGGAGGDLLGSLSGKTQQALQQSPRFQGIKNQKDIGGNTNLLSGVETTPAVRENVRNHLLGRENKTPQDIAAQKVAPKIQQSLDNQMDVAAAKINKQVQDYIKSPEGMELHSADPVVDRMLAMADKGTVSLPVSGRTVSANRSAAENIRKSLQEFSDFNHVSPEEAKAITEKHGGRILSDRQAAVLGLPQEPDKVHVVVPGKFNAEALLTKEDNIDRLLKYDTREGGVDNPVLQEMNLGFKDIRDKFKYGGERQAANQSIKPSSRPSETYDVRESDIAPSSVGEVRTEVTQDTVPPRDLTLQQDPVTGTRRELTPSEYSNGVEVEGPNVGNDWKNTVPEAEQYIKELDYKGNVEAQKAANRKTSELLNGEFSFADSPPITDKPNPFDHSELSEINKIRNEQKYAGDADPETLAARERVKARRNGSAQGKLDNEFKKPDSPVANNPTTPVIKIKGNTPIPVYEQRKLDLEKYLQTHEGHITKQMAGQKMGWDQKPEWQIDELVKEGKLEQVPAGEKKLGQVDIEYRVPKKSNVVELPSPASATPESSSIVEDLGESQYQEEVVPPPLPKAAPPSLPKVNQSVNIKSTMGLESQLDAQLLRRDIADQAKLDGVENPLNAKPNPNKDTSEVATNPTQLTATLDDGTVVYGFSALRRKQHEALTALKEAKKGTGSASKEASHRRVLGYKNGEGSPYENEALAKEADSLGIRQELEEVPATREYPGLRARAFGGGGEGPMNSLKDFFGFRGDAFLGAIAGEPQNPYAPMPNTPGGRIKQYLFRQGVPMRPLLEGRMAGARYGNEAADEWEESKRRNTY